MNNHGMCTKCGNYKYKKTENGFHRKWCFKYQSWCQFVAWNCPKRKG